LTGGIHDTYDEFSRKRRSQRAGGAAAMNPVRLDMDERFHAAQTALAAGDVKSMASLLEADPDLAKARSQRSHPNLMQCLVLFNPPPDHLGELIDLLAAQGSELTDPLIAAASMDNPRALTKLLDLGANIGGNGLWSPLEEALYFGSVASVSLLIERGAKIRNLRTAAGLGDLAYVARCFDDSGKLTAAAGEVAWPFFRKPIPEDIRRDPKQIIGNALIFAAAWGRSEVVNELIRRGAEINFTPAGFDYAGTPLHYAALEGRRAMVDQLLQMGADPSLQDTKIGKLPEDWADHAEHHELAEHLRQARLQTSPARSVSG
jgi:ankyrin repeat protein